MRSSLYLVTIASVIASACGATHALSALPPTAAGVIDPEWQAARRLAPDYVARVREADRAAESERTPEGRAEQSARIELLRSAARAEAARIALLRQADGYERRIAKAVEERAQLERQQNALQEARQMERAATAQRAEAQWVFSALARGGTASATDRDRIWQLLCSRAQALLAAATALGANGEPVTTAELQLTAARTAKLPERITKARVALQSASVALGQARAERPAPSAAERGDLQARVEALGLTPRVETTGLVIHASGSSDSLARLALLTDVLPGFPHGAVSIACRGACEGLWLSAMRQRLGPRLQADRGARVPDGSSVLMTLPAYGSSVAAQ